MSLSQSLLDTDDEEEDYTEDEHNLVRVLILDAKMDPSVVQELHELVENFDSVADPAVHLQLTSAAENADVVITNVHMRQRLERHIPWKLAVSVNFRSKRLYSCIMTTLCRGRRRW